MIITNTVGITILAVFILFILFKKEKQFSDYFLILNNALLILGLLINMWMNEEINTFTFIFNTLLSFFIFPAFFTYANLLIEPDHKIKKSWWWFYSYAVVFSVYVLIDFTILTDYDTALLEERYLYPTLVYHFFYKSHTLFVIGSSLWFLKRLKTYDNNLKDYYSFIEPIRLQWLKNVTITYMLIYSLIILSFLLYNFGLLERIETPYMILNIIVVIASIYMSYHGIQQYAIAQFEENFQTLENTKTPTIEEPIKTTVVEKEKYASSSLDNEQLKIIFQRILVLFEEEKLYEVPKLKIGEVAQKLNISVHQVSQVINTSANLPFYEFVNGYRVRALQEKLKNPTNKQFTILSLAMDCGFNSKASLNRIFKEHTNFTPSQYQKAHIIA